MKKITIDCAGLTSAEALHALLARELAFPDWYGSNLDALYDCMNAICEATELTLMHFGELPPFSGGFRWVLQDAENENDCLIVNFQ